ncbi:MAG: C25 family cysteine peptidase [Bacteroidota bacterium]
MIRPVFTLHAQSSLPYQFEVLDESDRKIEFACRFTEKISPDIYPVCNILLPFGSDSATVAVTRIAYRDCYIDSPWLGRAFLKSDRIVRIRNHPVLQLVFNPAIGSDHQKAVNITDLEVEVRFTTGEDQVTETKCRSRLWDGLISQLVLNPPKNSFAEMNDEGAEYLIIAHDIFLPQLNELKTYRFQQGISTVLAGTSETGTSAADIENYIDNAYNNWITPPSAILLVGDANLIGVPVWENYCISDNVYADVDGDDLPDLILGRLPVNTQTELNRYIDRLIAFETNPPADDHYYQHPLAVTEHGNPLAVNWMIAEIVNGWYETQTGKEPERQYHGDTQNWEWPDEELFAAFGPGGLGYLPEDPSYLMNYVNGTAAGINNAINAGAMTVFSSAHGLQTGWTNPTYFTSHLAGLENALPSVMISICSFNGDFNNGPTDCFAEAYLKYEHGGIGTIAASEVIHTIGSGWFTVGIFDGLWDDFYPAYPQPQPQDFIRPAAALAYGKYFLETNAFPINPQIKESFYHLFGFLGEPYSVLFDEMPQDLSVYHGSYISVEQTNFGVAADAGAIVALTMNGEIVGVEKSTGETLIFDLPAHELGDTLHVTATKHNFKRYDFDVVCSNAISIGEIAAGNLLLFPNPASTNLELKLIESITGTAGIRIMNLSGACIRDFSADFGGERFLALNVSDLSEGAYFLEIKTDDRILRKKFIIERQ